MEQKKLLIIGYVWPEPNSSAAGSRMLQLIHFFLEQQYQIVFASPAAESDYRFPLETIGVKVKEIVLNDASFDTYITELEPTIVLFDRFMMEEQFGWRVVKNCPKAFRVLDTEDLHCLRKARQEAVKAKEEFQLETLNSDIAKREIASIYRCDLTLMISSFEMQLLQDYFKVPTEILHLLPFLLDEIEEEKSNSLPSFEERKHFVTIGSFRHEPNWDSVRYLKEVVWPKLRKELPEAEMHIYGSYPPQKAMQLHKPQEKFYIKGWAESSEEVFKNARVCLAPLRFGAGIKGKFVEAMQLGTPSVTTAIGAEGMHADLPWNGFVKETVSEIVQAAKELYTTKEIWLQLQQNGIQIVNKLYHKETLTAQLKIRLEEIQKNLKAHRNKNFTGSMLLFHSMRSTEYMSRWIQEKNK